MTPTTKRYAGDRSAPLGTFENPRLLRRDEKLFVAPPPTKEEAIDRMLSLVHELEAVRAK